MNFRNIDLIVKSGKSDETYKSCDTDFIEKSREIDLIEKIKHYIDFIDGFFISKK